MKMKYLITLGVLALGASAWMLMAQGTGNSPRVGARPRPHATPTSPEGEPHRPPPPPIIGVLDANHDGVIDAKEIANASKALLQLDEDGDGQLTREELRPPPPPDDADGPPPFEGEGHPPLPPRGER